MEVQHACKVVFDSKKQSDRRNGDLGFLRDGLPLQLELQDSSSV